MQSFDILCRTTPIYRSALLEASAGTGKTFAIEHWFVRLLIEPDPHRQQACALPEILAMTFTRAATNEMKGRIRHNIAKAIHFLHHPALEPDVPDYLQAILTCSLEQQTIIRMRLEEALACFDEAQIFTLHGLCARALKERAENACGRLSESPLDEVVYNVIDDFFRTGLQPSLCHPLQLKRLLGHFRGDADALKDALAKQITAGLTIASAPNYTDRFLAFQKAMRHLSQTYQWQADKLLDDFDRQVHQYKNLMDKPPQGHRPAVERMALQFNQSSWSLSDFEMILRDDLVLAKLERKARAKPGSEPILWYPDASSLLQKHLSPIIDATLDPRHIFGWMAQQCQTHLQRYCEEEEIGGPDQILQQMLAALDDPQFASNIQRRYRVVIVDECQDTDPIQWAIIQRLFLQRNLQSHLILVGDPKQSIYAFRQADIYTYLSTADTFPSESRLALRTNFRSHPNLVHAVNNLFSQSHCPGLIALPRLQSALPFPAAVATPHCLRNSLSDNKGAIHFILLKAKRGRARIWPSEELERNMIFPAIAHEILNLSQNLKRIAILVRDRHQAALIQQVLDEWNIPALTQRHGSLADSSAYAAMIEWLEAMAHPHDTCALRRALMGPLIRVPAEYLVTGSSDEEQMWRQLSDLRKSLIDYGFAEHHERLLQSRWGGSGTVFENLLGSKEGTDFLLEWQQIAQLLIEHQYRTHSGLEGLLTFLDQFPLLAQHNDERMKIQPDLTQDAVRILSIHASKGLEYDIVFAPGLMKRTTVDNLLTPDYSYSPPCFRVAEEGSPAHQAFCQELDAEKARQAYVAITRARDRVYLPVAIAEEGSRSSLGQAAPVELLLNRLARPLADDQELYRRINSFDGQHLCDFIDSNKSQISFSYEWLEAPPKLQKRMHPFPPQMLAPRPIQVPQRPQRLSSYTSMHTGYIGEEASTELQAPRDDEVLDRTVHTLPAGRETGIAIHRLLEKLAFPLLAGAEDEESMRALVRPQLQPEALLPWAEVISSLLFHGMHTPLPFHGCTEPQRLRDVNPSCVLREAEFFYPTERTGYFRGSIDLLCRQNDRYYLIDWKSNWLGPTRDFYTLERLQKVIKQQGYDIQAQIYADAVRSYLALFDRRPFDECFGGVFFLFLRGLDSRAKDRHGIYRAEVRT